MLRSKKSLLFFQFARNKLYLIFFILIYTDFPLKQKHSYLFFSFRILPISSKKKTRFLNKEPRSLQKSVFMMNKTKEEKKSLSTFTKFIRPPSILVSEFLLWKKERMHLMKTTKKILCLRSRIFYYQNNYILRANRTLKSLINEQALINEQVGITLLV